MNAFEDNYVTYTPTGTEKRVVRHAENNLRMASFQMDCAEGHIMFGMLRETISNAGGTLMDMDTGTYLR